MKSENTAIEADAGERRLMKHGIDKHAVERIAGALSIVWKKFPADAFIADALDGLDERELKERVRHLIDVMSRYLPQDFDRTAAILAEIPRRWKPGDPDDALRGFAAWPLIDYAAVHGLQHPETALDLLHDLTSMFSAEFAVRPFLREHWELSYNRMLAWCDDPEAPVRRLASEGIRPRLPWGERVPSLMTDPSPILTILERLKDDPSEFVRRSVANNLNDISKDHPEVVLETCRSWLEEATPEREWIVRHATRTLVKAGRPEVFPLLGYTDNPDVRVEEFRLDRERMRLGEELTFTATLISTASVQQRAVLDYGLHFVKANGSRNRKVFKLKTVRLAPGERLVVKKAHSIREITTRRYYPGEQRIELLINGLPFAETGFMLEVE